LGHIARLPDQRILERKMEENGREEGQGRRDTGEKCQIRYRKELGIDRRK
jgi:hypothetical protein